MPKFNSQQPKGLPKEENEVFKVVIFFLLSSIKKIINYLALLVMQYQKLPSQLFCHDEFLIQFIRKSNMVSNVSVLSTTNSQVCVDRISFTSMF